MQYEPSSKKVHLIYWLKPKERGSGETACFMAQSYPSLFQPIDYERETVPDDYRVWIMHNPHTFKFPKTQRFFKDYMYIRQEYCNEFPCHHLTNGYSYYCRHIEDYQAWFPSIYISDHHCSKTPSVGYYARDVRVETNFAFGDFVAKLPAEVQVVTMGNLDLVKPLLCNRVNWRHVYDREVFFSSCSHYFYHRPKDIEDPLPHTLLEAIQSGHRIISPKNPSRNFTDGIDDLLSFVDYDQVFIEGNAGKCPDILKDRQKWEKYLTDITQEKFPRSKVVHGKLLYDWACKFL